LNGPLLNRRLMRVEFLACACAYCETTDYLSKDTPTLNQNRQLKGATMKETQNNQISPNPDKDAYHNRQLVKRLIRSYGGWFTDHINSGWQGYLLSFKFSQLSGSDHLRMLEMKKHLGWF
jgi:hypothetical protein